MLVVATWTVEQHGTNEFYVVQKIVDGSGHIKYGPMPRDFVEPFVAELKAVVQRSFKRSAHALLV